MLLPSSSPSPRIYLFGCQALAFGDSDLVWIRSALAATEELQWILDVVHELPSLLHEYASSNPQFDDTRPRALLQELAYALRTGPDAPTPAETFVSDNACLTPLVVIGQLIQYFKLSSSGSIKSSGSREETLGFCTGLLSAFAVASSRSSERHLAKYGAVAIRLAMLIGATVDAEESPNTAGPSRSLAVAWSNEESCNGAMRVLHSVPGVCLDGNQSTCCLLC